MIVDEKKVTVTFSITIDYQKFIQEDELNDPSNPFLDTIRASERIEGAINISAPGQPNLQFRDVLAPWVQNLCFRGVWNLAHGQPATVYYFGSAGTVVFTPNNSEVRFNGDNNPDALYSKSELLHALVNCGSRFIAFAEIIKKDDYNYLGNINYVKGFQAMANEALKFIDAN
jgi:hypothetical protein